MAATAQTLDELQQMAGQMQRRYIDNLQQFSLHQPALHAHIAQRTLQHTQVDLSEHGMRLLTHGHSVYPDDPWHVSRQQVNDFLVNPDSFALYPLAPSADSNCQNTFLRNIIPMQKNIPQAITAYQYDRHNTPLLICFGIGTGYHLEHLSKKLKLRHLVLYEANVEFLLASLYCIDWRQVFAHFIKPHHQLDIILGDNIEHACEQTLTSVRKHSPIFATQYLFFHHIAGDYYTELRLQLKKILPLAARGFGFYDDEKQGLQHTAQNLRNRHPLLNSALKKYRNFPVFIVAAGPSLDTRIATLRKHREQVILISCGTAIGALLHHNIVPDIHIEQERLPYVDRALTLLAQTEKLKQIHLIALNVVCPEVSRHFASCSLALKNDDSGSSLFPVALPRLSYTHPVAANFGSVLALTLGFKSIYLFGVDMGMKSAGKHHADGTIYEMTEKDATMAAYKPITDSEVAGNFGGAVLCNDLYTWGIKTLSQATAVFPTQKVYNCSDGAYISGTHSLAANALLLPTASVPRARVRNAIASCFSRSSYSLKHFTDGMGKMCTEIKSVQRAIQRQTQTPCVDRADIIDTLDAIYFCVHNSNNLFATQIILGAVIKNALLYIYAHSNTYENVDQATQYTNQQLPIVEQFIDDIRHDLETFTAGLQG